MTKEPRDRELKTWSSMEFCSVWALLPCVLGHVDASPWQGWDFFHNLGSMHSFLEQG